MLRLFFPSSDEGAALYQGFMKHRNCFGKFFDMKETIEESLVEMNNFLEANGYDKVSASQLDETYSYENFPITVSPHGYTERLILYIDRDSPSRSQTSFLTDEIKKFRDERDWAQFHNSKDLAIALSIESNELLEQFLWKSPDEANEEKIKEELADVFIYALLLADKLKIDIEEIVLHKIRINAEKYPIEKFKGIVKKYNGI